MMTTMTFYDINYYIRCSYQIMKFQLALAVFIFYWTLAKYSTKIFSIKTYLVTSHGELLMVV